MPGFSIPVMIVCQFKYQYTPRAFNLYQGEIMKRFTLAALLFSFTCNVFAINIDYTGLSKQAQEIAKEIGKLVILPSQPLPCRATLTEASTEVFGAATLLSFKSDKLAKKAIQKSLAALIKTIPLSCNGGEVILKAEADLVAMDLQI